MRRFSGIGFSIVRSFGKGWGHLHLSYEREGSFGCVGGVRVGADAQDLAAMNGAVIAIGCRNPKLEKPTLAAAARIGKVQVDHGDTACQTPDAAVYIRKAAARRKDS